MSAEFKSVTSGARPLLVACSDVVSAAKSRVMCVVKGKVCFILRSMMDCGMITNIYSDGRHGFMCGVHFRHLLVGASQAKPLRSMTWKLCSVNSGVCIVFQFTSLGDRCVIS